MVSVLVLVEVLIAAKAIFGVAKEEEGGDDENPETREESKIRMVAAITKKFAVNLSVIVNYVHSSNFL